MNRRSLMISTMLMSAMGIGGVVGNVWAADVQCLKTPSCEELGYTEVACFQNNGVKCPYGDKYFCVCPTNYKFTCTGENQTGGVGDTCNGKYASCNCSGDLKWNDGTCVEHCPIGSILFNDFTCSYDVVSGKTPIGVVVYKNGKGAGQALALNWVENKTSYYWSTENIDITSLTNYATADKASQDFSSCSNSQKIMAQGNSTKYPAVWAAYNYTTTGTSVGQWCLPSAGIITEYYNNQDIINTAFSRANGAAFTNTTYTWSSSEAMSNKAWLSSFGANYGLTYGSMEKDYGRYVRPVIGFCDETENYVYDQATDSCVQGNMCRLGSIFYSDMTCSVELSADKTPIGVVVYVDENGSKAQVMALNSVNGGTTYVWGPYNTIGHTDDISDLTNYSSALDASKDVASCENSEKIRAHGDSSIHPAVWAAYDYSTEGTEVGDWCLPAAGIFTSYYNSLYAINIGYSRAKGAAFTESNSQPWSSSEIGSGRAWSAGDVHDSYGVDHFGKDVSHEVYPVLEGNLTSEGEGFCLNSYQYTCDGANETGGSSTSCGGKYQSCNCASGYEWKDGSCVAQCDSSYQYACTSGSYVTGGSGMACGGKYEACTCSSPYKWDSSSGSCVCAAQLTCTGEHETGGSGISCNGKYYWCSCESGYEWVGCYISGEWKGCMPEIVGGEYICGD